MSQAQYPKTGALDIAASVQAGMAGAVIHLYKSPVALSPNLTLADMVAVEANYDGYAAQTVATWNPPYLDPAGGATTASGYKQFNYATEASPGTTNNIYGLFVENAAGVLILVMAFDAPAPMGETGDSVPVNVLLNYGS
jgi:hypothetical protein